MTLKQKLTFILDDYLPYSQHEIAQKLGISTGRLSQWKSQDSLKEYHYYALQGAFNIPIEIFENEAINTKEKIINLLNKRSNTNKSPFNKALLKLLQGKWYVYSYHSLSNEIEEDILQIENKKITHINKSGNIGYQGEILEINEAYALFSLTKEHNKLYMLLPVENLHKEILYGMLFTKNNLLRDDFAQFFILSKKRIDLEQAKIILGDKSQLQLHLNRDFLERIIHFQNNELEVAKYSNEDFFEFLKSQGEIYLYPNTDTPFIHTLKFHRINSIKLYSNNKLSMTGKMRFYKNEVLIDFEDYDGEKLFLNFDKVYKDVMPFGFKGVTYKTSEHIVGIGVMSFKKLDKETVSHLIGKKGESILSISKVWERVNQLS